MGKRKINDGVPLAQRSETLKKIGNVRNLKRLQRGDRAFLLAKINSEQGNPVRSGIAGHIAIDTELKDEYCPGTIEKARALGYNEEAKEAAKKQIEHSIRWSEEATAVRVASEFGLHEMARESAIKYAKRLVLEGEDSAAEGLLKEFEIEGGLPALKNKLIEELEAEKQYLKLARLAKRFSLGEKMKEAAIKSIQNNLNSTLFTVQKIAEEFEISEEEVCRAIEDGVQELVEDGNHFRLSWVVSNFTISEELMGKARKCIVIELANEGKNVEALHKSREYGIPPEEVKDIAIKAIKFQLGSFRDAVDDGIRIADDFGITKKELSRIAEEEVDGMIGKGSYVGAAKIASKIPISRDRLEFLKCLLEVFHDA
jgi:hypothetical protein